MMLQIFLQNFSCHDDNLVVGSGFFLEVEATAKFKQWCDGSDITER